MLTGYTSETNIITSYWHLVPHSAHVTALQALHLDAHDRCPLTRQKQAPGHAATLPATQATLKDQVERGSAPDGALLGKKIQTLLHRSRQRHTPAQNKGRYMVCIRL